MKRSLSPLAAASVLLLAASPSLAQEEGPAVAPVRLTLRPAGEPTPALKYHLLPELRELKPGNAALLYYRAFSPDWLTHLQPKVAKRLDEHEAHPNKVPLDEFRWVLHDKALQEIDLAARREFCNWELTERARKEGIALLMPDLQGFRGFARVLMLRARLEMVEGRHDRVTHSLQTGFAVARHVADGPTLIHALVGAFLARLTLDETRQWIQQPGAPNLYWALTDLPRPLIDLRKPLQGESLFLDQLFPEARDTLASDRPLPLSPAQLDAMMLRLRGAWQAGGERRSGELEDRLNLAVQAAKAYPQARRTLLANGWQPRDVDALPVIQTYLLFEVATYDRIYDELRKWTALPYEQARPRIDQTLERLKRDRAEQASALAYLYLPGLEKVLDSQAFLQRKVDALRCVEALRLYAVAHDGKLPARLDEITDVPVPADPVTGKPFGYRAAGDTATLSAPPPPGQTPNPANTLVYEITLKK
ncbi:MAG: hypothetical protein HYS12_20140 [Planctomycetes bacterium]|nr:hypothetical protein [Planctomycetota bacterium]